MTAEAATTNAAAIYSAFEGKWTGVLEYRDYQSDKRVQLPTWLEVKDTPDSRA